MNVIFAGSRHIELTVEELDSIVRESGFAVACVFDGGASGVDQSAAEWARARGKRHRRFLADWRTHGRAAGPIRNREMIDAGAHALIAVWDGKSRGTADMVRQARAAGLPTCVVRR